MGKLITVQKAKADIERLQSYVELVENYMTDTLERWVFKTT